MFLKQSFIALFSVLLLASCGGSSTETPETPTPDAKPVASVLKVVPANVAKEYPDVELNIESLSSNKGKVNYKINITGDYELASQTEGAGTRNCANSGKGQHLHWIVDNQAYQAKYADTFSYEFSEDKTYLALGFLSRSYHESIKNGKAAKLVLVEGANSGSNPYNLDDPHLFYSRPKGTYKGADTKKVLLDFYLHNVELSETGNKVLAIINHEEFTLTSWQPYFIEGLKLGVNTIQLKLIDSEGNVIPGPFNDSGERTITLVEA